MSTNTLVKDEATDATNLSQTENQASSKTYTQQEVDDMLARMKGSLQKKLLKPYEDLGDPDELRQLRVEAEQRRQEQQIKRGEFEKTLQELAAKKDAEIQRRDAIIRDYKVTAPVITAAAKYRAVNPEQVQTLLNPHLRLNQTGDVEVVDNAGSVRYTDTGQPMPVEDFVREWLDANPHFVTAAPATTNTQSNVRGGGGQAGKIDVSRLNMKNPEHRKIYAEARQAGRV
jgi:hypothetical protein